MFSYKVLKESQNCSLIIYFQNIGNLLKTIECLRHNCQLIRLHKRHRMVVYQKFIQHDPCARGKKALLIVVSTDGAPLIKSKKFKKPLICFLVELPPQERYKFENILLTGLWHGKSKPHLPPFLKHFTGELFNMANGSNFNNETCELVSSVCKIQSVIPHLPAKALLLK